MDDVKIIDYTKKLNRLADKAISEISSLKQPVIQFCGPISTGGFGSDEYNIAVLKSYIDESIKSNISVFNQMKYEDEFNNILPNNRDYDYLLLEIFYRKIISSNNIKALIFIPLWQTSKGSVWEHEFAKSINKPIFYSENGLLSEIKSIYEKISP